MAADGTGKMEGVSVPAVFGDLAQGQAGGADELDGVLDLEPPDHGAGAFVPGFTEEHPEPAGGEAHAVGEVLGGMELGVVGGGDIEGPFQGGMRRGNGVALIQGTGVGGEAEQARSGEGRHGFMDLHPTVVLDGQTFVDKEVDRGGGRVKSAGPAEKALIGR